MLGTSQASSILERPAPLEVEPPYHVLSNRQKWSLVLLVSLAGAFSPLSSNIYFPAINTISSDLDISKSLVALTITIYMIVQGIAPSFFGAISDSYGRRLTFTIALIIYTVSNIALTQTSSFPMLMVLRGLQAAGSSATISISAGVIADIACPQERGGFMGTNAGVRMSGQALGPVIGGVLNNTWGFRSIFWLLFVLSVTVLLALLIFLPETQRSVAGNGSIPLSGFHKPFIYYIKAPEAIVDGPAKIATKSRKPLSFKKSFGFLVYILEKDIAVLLIWGSVTYTAWSMVTSSTTTTLLRGFPFLNEWQIGLCFLPNGLGCVFGSLWIGWLMNLLFEKAKEKHQAENANNHTEGSPLGDDFFPLLRTRLRPVPYLSVAFILSMGLYGPSLELNDLQRYFTPNLAAPLILQFVIAFTSTAIFNINSTVLIDNFTERPASATALNNLCRCLLGAAGVSVIQPLIDVVKARNAFLILTGTVSLFTPLIWAEWKWGEKWKLRREAAGDK